MKNSNDTIGNRPRDLPACSSATELPYFSGSTRRYADNIKNYVKNTRKVGPLRLDSSGLGYEPAADFCDAVSHLRGSMNE